MFAAHFDLNMARDRAYRLAWVKFGDQVAIATPQTIESLRASERLEQRVWRPLVDEIVSGLVEIGRGVRKKSRYVHLADFQSAVA